MYFTDQRQIVGQSGEELATKYLELSGYKILERNFRCKIGEIDIIATNEDVLCFVEVKTRLSTVTGNPSESVTYTKQQKIRRTAQFYMLKHDLLENMPIISFDVIEIVINKNKVILFNHFPHCF